MHIENADADNSVLEILSIASEANSEVLRDKSAKLEDVTELIKEQRRQADEIDALFATQSTADDADLIRELDNLTIDDPVYDQAELDAARELEAKLAAREIHSAGTGQIEEPTQAQRLLVGV